jgi:hypothetical protein
MKSSATLHLLAAALFSTVLSIRPAEAELLAPVYPGSVAISQDERGHVFYTRDQIGKALTFYRTQLGEPRELRAGRSRGDGREYHWVLKTYDYVNDAGVHLSTPEKPPEQVTPEQVALLAGMGRKEMSGTDPKCLNHELFEPLEHMVIQLPHRDGRQFAQVCRRFVHLTWSLFPYTEELDERGRPLRRDQYLLNRYRQQIAPPSSGAPSPASPEEIAARMQALAMAGRMDGARELARAMADGQRPARLGPGVRMDSGQVVDHWDDWTNLLEEIDKYAYRTRILIQTDPDSRPQRRE